MNKARVAVVVLNWNGKVHLERFLSSVVENIPEFARLFVADNASTDNSVEFLAGNFPQVNILHLGSNYGFAGGYNRALRQVDAEYFVLLNSDVEVTPGWIAPIVEFMESRPGVVAAQPKILSFAEKEKFEYAGAAGGFMDVLGYPFCRGRILHHLEADHGQYNNETQILWATGACLFVRADAFWEAGGFDEQFFAHMEEIDLCLRLHRMGYMVASVPGSKVYHLGGGTLSSTSPRKTYLNFRNSLWVMAKNWPGRYFYPLIPIRLALDVVAAFIFMAKGNFRGAYAVFQAHWEFSKKWIFMRRLAPSCSQKLPDGVLMGSIVLNFYLKRIKRFSQLQKFRKNYI